MNINDFYKSYLSITIPHMHQIKMWEKVKKGKYPILLKAPTGSGKTEAPLALFSFTVCEKQISHCITICVLPTVVLVK